MYHFALPILQCFMLQSCNQLEVLVARFTRNSKSTSCSSSFSRIIYHGVFCRRTLFHTSGQWCVASDGTYHAAFGRELVCFVGIIAFPNSHGSTGGRWRGVVTNESSTGNGRKCFAWRVRSTGTSLLPIHLLSFCDCSTTPLPFNTPRRNHERWWKV